MSIPRWCGVGHCRSRGRLQQLLAVGLVGRELLPHFPTSGLRVGGGAGGGAAETGRGPRELRELGHEFGVSQVVELRAQHPQLMQAQA